MKRITSILAAAAMVFGLAACDKCQDKADCGCDVNGGELRNVEIALAGCGINVTTRVEGVTDAQESAVNDCQLYIFTNSGAFVDRLTSNGSAFSTYLADGVYQFYAFVNVPALPAKPESAQSLLASAVGLADNSVGNFTMDGSLDNVNIASDTRLTISVKRMVAKFDYSIKVKMASTLLAAKTFTVQDIYMTNVQGRNNFLLSAYQPSEGLWYYKRNRGELDSNYDCDGLIYANIGKTVAQGDSLVSGHVLYAFPNNQTDPADRAGWSARSTRFVVKADIGGETWYYPVTVSPVERNKYYHIDMTITGPGVPHPEDKPQKQSFLDAFITVLPWDDGGVITSTF